jgi:hypothetical protein
MYQGKPKKAEEISGKKKALGLDRISTFKIDNLEISTLHKGG